MSMEGHFNEPWLDASAPHGEVVLSCRARLARNIAGFPFVNHATAAQRKELLRVARQVLLGGGLSSGMIWVDLGRATEHDRRLLVERHLISKNLADSDIDRAVAISGDESLSVMVNEEDHLRIQILAAGLQLESIHERLNEIDDHVEGKVDYAFSRRWGYLTACPTNVGTGIRFSVMMHLPALKITNEIDRVRRAAKDLHLAVRGYYGEGSESAGDFYQISNQVTLGRSEEELLGELKDKILPRIIEYEQQARRVLVERNETLLDDRTQRALGILRSARLLGAEEAMKLLSRVRLAIALGRLPEIDPRVVNQLFLQVQPAHLQFQAERPLSAEQLRVTRATIVRKAFA
ncbi:MAG: protein arginine kinase [Phycisphaerales bacterium]|nr:protein arginine kinase [Phycisphaerae bacterium]NNF44436.1 protein arginine kinase [Phycisphaerales bacterium]NNM26211.1 protein arginine kinase [Phycisphaerales bacterium]